MSDRTRALVLIVLGLLMVFVGPPAMLVDGNRKAAILNELGRHGRRELASVMATSPSYSRNVQVTYAFEANGKTYHKTEDVSSPVMDRARQQGQIEVRYSATNPDVSTVDAERLERSAENLRSWGPWVIAAMGLLFASIGASRLRRLN